MTTEHDKEPADEPGRDNPDAAAAQGDAPQEVVDFSQLPPELKIAALTERLEAAEADAEKYRSDVQYKEAELQTERRRFAEQRAILAKYRDEDLLLDLLPVIEGLELALNLSLIHI